MPNRAPGIRLLPNAITVLALCSGLSAVMFALQANYAYSVLALGVAALLDGLDGRLARLLDATSRMGAELDSLADAVSFGVSPALVLFVWGLHTTRIGWVVALVYAVCMVLRLARFNTLLDDTTLPPFAKEFFVGVPAPAGALLVTLPLVLSLQFGAGWWTDVLLVSVWTVGISALLISRIPTLAVKSAKVSPRHAAPLLVLVALIAAAVVTFPFIALAVAMLLYLLHVPYAVRRYHWLAAHPEAWSVPPRERRAIRQARSRARLGIRPPLRRRVAGAARRAVGLSNRDGREPFPRNGFPTTTTRDPLLRDGTRGRNGRGPGRRDWRRLTLRRRQPK